MATTYLEAPEVEKIAKKLIPTMGWVSIPAIKYLMMFSERSSYLGRCSKATGKWKHLTGVDFVLEIWNTFFDSADEEAREALIHHELMHIKSKEDDEGNVIWGIRKHDCEEFFATVLNYGAWDLPTKTLVEKIVDYEKQKAVKK